MAEKNTTTTTVALAGQPNVGKSTVFNLLTGLNQHVGNWPGKTIEQKTGTCTLNSANLEIVDLPGNYERTEEGKVVPREGKLVADLIGYCQREWPGNGVGLYLYSMLSDEQIEALRTGPFEEEAVPKWVR